jgi:sulfonate transport system ATP-binding protein
MKRSALHAEQKRLEPVVEQPEPSPGLRAASDAAVGIRIMQATKAFGERVVFSDLSLAIQPGEFVAAVGRSGCGKTTLLRLIAGLETVDSGRIAVDGTPVADLRNDVRLLFQEPRLLPWHRVISNVGIARGRDWRALAQSALVDVGLDDRANDWPAVLSGGQRQRVALARALVRHPKALLMDEPFGALDALTRAEMHKLLIRIRREYGFTAVLITHDVREALALADRIVVLREGMVVLDEPINVPLELRGTSPRLGHLEHRVLAEV